MIRHAVGADLPRLMVWARAFHEASGLPCGFDEDATRAFLLRMMGNDDAAVLIGENGAIGGVLAPHYCDPNWKAAIELFWWSERGGLALLRAFEDWARGVGAAEVRMTSLASLPRADGVLRHKGYQPTEISYSKVM